MAQLNTEVLTELEGLTEEGAPNILIELVGLYETNGAVLFETLRSSIAQNNFKEFERAAHTLKGSSASLGFSELAEALYALEKKGHAEQIQGTEAQISEVEKELRASIVLLREYLQNQSA